MSLQTMVVTQFHRPHGILGHIAGWIMAHRPSNRDRNRWTVDLLDIQPDDDVLEIGCGPGLALEACLKRVTRSRVMGLDHSQAMLDQAAARNARALSEGRLILRLGAWESLRDTEQQFDKIFSVNVVQFLDDPAAAFDVLHATLKPGGTAATTYMPRGKNPTREQAHRMANDVKRCMENSGFIRIKLEELPLNPVPAVCVLGTRA
jgi:cyclopropane fatty-acyl-phospholipid synthase-like methyltransferase